MAVGDEDRLRTGYAAFNEGGIEAVLDWLAPEITIRDRDSLPDRETHHGLTGILAVFDSMSEAFDQITLEPVSVVDRGDRIVVSLRQKARGRGSGIEIESEVAHLWTMAGGVPVGLRMFRNVEQALDALRDD